VIERRVLQLFPDEAERIRGLERLVARLVTRGIFVSHQHSGWWKPGEPRQHYAEAWLAGHGFESEFSRAAAGPEDAAAAPLARLIYTTG
jgi:hypothetical protein